MDLPEGWEWIQGISSNGDLYLAHRGDEIALWIRTEDSNGWQIIEHPENLEAGRRRLSNHRNAIHRGDYAIEDLASVFKNPLWGRM